MRNIKKNLTLEKLMLIFLTFFLSGRPNKNNILYHFDKFNLLKNVSYRLKIILYGILYYLPLALLT